MKKFTLILLSFLTASTVFGSSLSTSKQSLNNYYKSCDNLRVKLGAKWRPNIITIYNTKFAPQKSCFANSSSSMLFARVKFTKTWGIEAFGGLLGQGMDTDRQRPVKRTLTKKRNRYDLFPVITVDQVVGSRALLLWYKAAGAAIHFYPEEQHGHFSYLMGLWGGKKISTETPIVYNFKRISEENSVDLKETTRYYENLYKDYNWGVVVGAELDVELVTLGLDANIGLMNIAKNTNDGFYTFSANLAIGLDVAKLFCYSIYATKKYFNGVAAF